MKTTLFVLFILCAAVAFGQTAPVLPNQVQIVEVPDHPGHAALHEMAPEQSLVGGSPSAYTYAQGERPLWEFGPVCEPVPLGDVARAYRKQKLTAKKAEIVFEKQGS
jgi:proline-rich tail region repeat protein